MKYQAAPPLHTVQRRSNRTFEAHSVTLDKMFVSKYSCQSIRNHWCKGRLKDGSQ